MNEAQETRLALASLFGALVVALDKSHPGVAEEFKRETEAQYGRFREMSDTLALMETLKWARDVVAQNLAAR